MSLQINKCAKSNCFKDIIKVYGACVDDCLSTSFDEWYINDLPGINIINASEVADGETVTGVNLLEKCINTAGKVVSRDFIRLLSNPKYGGLRFKNVYGQIDLKGAGNEQWIGETNEWYAIEVWKTNCDSFTDLQVFDLGLFVDRDIQKKIYIESDDRQKTEVTVDLFKGYNTIPLQIKTDRPWVRIFLDVSNVKLGQSDDCGKYADYVYGTPCGESCGNSEGKCTSCAYVAIKKSTDSVEWEDESFYGFDLQIMCRFNTDSLACALKNELAMSAWYMAGICFLWEVLATAEATAYTRNSKEISEKLLLDWYGGLDMTTGIHMKSKYWNELISVVQGNKHWIRKRFGKYLYTTGNIIDNKLPG